MTHPRRVALAVVASALAFASGARADEPAAAAVPPVAAAVAPSLPPPDERPPARGPNFVMLGLGLASFANAYAIAAIAGATSSYRPDRDLFVPILGPWLDLANRAGCSPQGAPSCHAERVNRASFVVDGVFQGVGVLAVAAALAFRWPHPDTSATATAAPVLELAPVQYAGGMGLAALGTF